MTQQELNDFLESHQNIEWAFEYDDDNNVTSVLFRDPNLPWYNESPTNATRVTLDTLEKLDQTSLIKAIRSGLDVEQITRVTGYFTKVSHVNPGKAAEIRDRVRTPLS